MLPYFLPFLTLLILLQGADAASFDKSKVTELSHSKRWLRLLHYKTHLFRGFRTSVDGDKFFFSPEGATDPEKEMVATIEAMESKPQDLISQLKQPLVCAFPARFRFLNEELHMGWTQPNCDRFKEFLSRFHGAESVTLVFSTAYPNNPASMFGHTFLRINGKKDSDGEKLDLLDYGLNYAAQVPEDENPFLFAFFGLAGGYVGSFSTAPYYAKVQEYNNSESRDLWEYNLDINADQAWWLLANVWELEVNSYFDYYFLDENCSYQMLTLLEVARPDWNLSSYFFHMIPGESVKKLTNTPGAVTGIKYRASVYKKMVAYGDRLSTDDREVFKRLIKGESVSLANVAVLETGAQYFNYLKQKNEGHLTTEQTKIFQNVLLERSRRKEASLGEPILEEKSRPELGHHPSRFSLGVGRMPGTDSYGWMQELGIRFAYHDLMNSDLGYTPYSEINFPNFTFRIFPKENRFWVEKVELFSIYSLSAWSWLKDSFSWRAYSAYEVPFDLCSYCHVWHGEGEMGFSQALFNDRWRAYELFGAYGEVGTALRHSFRVGSKFNIGVIMNLHEHWKNRFDLDLATDPFRGGSENYHLIGAWSQSYFLSQSWEFRLKLRRAQRLSLRAQNRNEGIFSVVFNY